MNKVYHTKWSSSFRAMFIAKIGGGEYLVVLSMGLFFI